MPLAVDLTLIGVLVILAIALVPLLAQVRRTARGLEAFLLVTEQHLSRIQEDIHASRLRMDRMAASLQAGLDEVEALADLVGEVRGTVGHLHHRFRDGTRTTAGNLGAILGGVGAVLTFFKSRPSQSSFEQDMRP